MKVVIPAAGLGTRFLPATKSQPKEMLPVLDRPVIQYVVEEAIAAGADDITIVTGRGKRALEDHFDRSPEFDPLSSRPEIRRLDELARKATIHYVRQPEARGLADAIVRARQHIGPEAFGVLLGDTINECNPPLLRQLWDHYKDLGRSIIAVEPVSDDKTRDYGIVEGRLVRPGVYHCERLLEKPGPEATKSRLGITGAYVFTHGIFKAIDETRPSARGEVELTDALAILSSHEPVFAALFSGIRHDIGDRFLWLKANLEFAIRDPTIRERLLPLIRTLAKDPEARD